ncbi:hypothetical protein MKS88_001178 [Plasmodium brasilianum]|uniref:Uncharacterized protein n=1 Tax=Plasmodium brasilianum TaxID=5824 RepID=A0ACB9YEY1_PLABR|nr:hypothetical protein MKS88_001178 [Plasmodium brasilianum]
MPCIVKVRISGIRDFNTFEKCEIDSFKYIEVTLGETKQRKKFHINRNRNDLNLSFRLEIADDSELQTCPLKITIDDVENIISGYIQIDFSFFYFHDNLKLEGWFPLYDSLAGLRGELYCSIKWEFFEEKNPYNDNSADVLLLGTTSFPNNSPYHIEQIINFAHELKIVNDPEYDWKDLIRSNRNSNEARCDVIQNAFMQTRKIIGKKAKLLGGNAILGYQEHLNLEGSTTNNKFRLFQRNLYSTTKPLRVLLTKTANRQHRDEWLVGKSGGDELKSNAKFLSCNVVLGYKEDSYIFNDVIVLFCYGTAINILPSFFHDDKIISFANNEKNKHHTLRGNSINSTKNVNCVYLHYSSDEIENNKVICRVCNEATVPKIFISSSNVPQNLAVIGNGFLISAFVVYPLKKYHGEHLASEISEILPFLELNLHKQIICKLLVSGFNSIFDYNLKLCFNQNYLFGYCYGTGMCSYGIYSENKFLIKSNYKDNFYIRNKYISALELKIIYDNINYRSFFSKNKSLISPIFVRGDIIYDKNYNRMDDDKTYKSKLLNDSVHSKGEESYNYCEEIYSVDDNIKTTDRNCMNKIKNNNYFRLKEIYLKEEELLNGEYADSNNLKSMNYYKNKGGGHNNNLVEYSKLGIKERKRIKKKKEKRKAKKIKNKGYIYEVEDHLDNITLLNIYEDSIALYNYIFNLDVKNYLVNKRYDNGVTNKDNAYQQQLEQQNKGHNQIGNSSLGIKPNEIANMKGTTICVHNNCSKSKTNNDLINNGQTRTANGKMPMNGESNCQLSDNCKRVGNKKVGSEKVGGEKLGSEIIENENVDGKSANCISEHLTDTSNDRNREGARRNIASAHNHLEDSEEESQDCGSNIRMKNYKRYLQNFEKCISMSKSNEEKSISSNFFDKQLGKFNHSFIHDRSERSFTYDCDIRKEDLNSYTKYFFYICTLDIMPSIRFETFYEQKDIKDPNENCMNILSISEHLSDERVTKLVKTNEEMDDTDVIKSSPYCNIINGNASWNQNGKENSGADHGSEMEKKRDMAKKEDMSNEGSSLIYDNNKLIQDASENDNTCKRNIGRKKEMNEEEKRKKKKEKKIKYKSKNTYLNNLSKSYIYLIKRINLFCENNDQVDVVYEKINKAFNDMYNIFIFYVFVHNLYPCCICSIKLHFSFISFDILEIMLTGHLIKVKNNNAINLELQNMDKSMQENLLKHFFNHLENYYMEKSQLILNSCNLCPLDVDKINFKKKSSNIESAQLCFIKTRRSRVKNKSSLWKFFFFKFFKLRLFNFTDKMKNVFTKRKKKSIPNNGYSKNTMQKEREKRTIKLNNLNKLNKFSLLLKKEEKVTSQPFDVYNLCDSLFLFNELKSYIMENKKHIFETLIEQKFSSTIITPLNVLPNVIVKKYFGVISLHIVKENINLKNFDFFYQSLISDILFIAKSHIKAIGANMLSSFKITNLFLREEKSHGYALISICGDVAKI